MLFLKKLLTSDKYVILSLLLLTLLFCRESFVVLQNVMIIVIICTKIIIQHHLVKTNGKFWWHRHTFKLENYVEIFWNMPGKIKQLFSWSELTEKESLKKHIYTAASRDISFDLETSVLTTSPHGNASLLMVVFCVATSHLCCDFWVLMRACFFSWVILVTCLTFVLKLIVTVFFSLYFQIFWWKWLNFFL